MTQLSHAGRPIARGGISPRTFRGKNEIVDSKVRVELPLFFSQGPKECLPISYKEMGFIDVHIPSTPDHEGLRLVLL